MSDGAEIVEEQAEIVEIVSDNEVEIARINADAAVEIAKIVHEDDDEEDDITWLSNRLDDFAAVQENIQLSQAEILKRILEMMDLLRTELEALKLLLTPIYSSPAGPIYSSPVSPPQEARRPENADESRAPKTGRIRRFL